MARKAAKLSKELAVPTLELFKGLYHSITSVGTTAIPVPATNLSYRKAVVVQNLDSAKTVYIGGSIPDIFEAPIGFVSMIEGTRHQLKWRLSGSGSNEYYAVSSSGGDPSLTEPIRIYAVTAAGGSESLMTNAAAGSLSDHEWDWGNTDTLGFNTVYFADSTGSPEDLAYVTLIGYSRVPDSSTNYGHRLGPSDAISLTLDGSVRVFAIASAASANVSTLELV